MSTHKCSGCGLIIEDTMPVCPHCNPKREEPVPSLSWLYYLGMVMVGIGPVLWVFGGNLAGFDGADILGMTCQGIALVLFCCGVLGVRIALYERKSESYQRWLFQNRRVDSPESRDLFRKDWENSQWMGKI